MDSNLYGYLFDINHSQNYFYDTCIREIVAMNVASSQNQYNINLNKQFDRITLKYDNLECRRINKADLSVLAKWPKFDNPAYVWANYPATSSNLQERWYKNQSKSYILWLVIHDTSPDEPDLVGRCSITQPLSGDELLYGIVVRPDVVDQGLGTRITKMVLKGIFERTQIPAIWLESRQDNHRAHRVWEKVGFDKLGNHYRREVFGRYDKYIGYRFLKKNATNLPDIEIISKDE